MTLAPVADAFTFSVYPDLNFGSSSSLEVYNSAQNDAMWSFLRFDLQDNQSPIPPGSTITSAELQLYLSGFSGQERFSVPLYSVDQPWSESTITWSNQPPSDTLFSTTSVPATNGWVTWTATTLVQEWWSGARTNQGLVLLPGSTNAMQLFFPSREDATNQPRLVITFTPP